MEVEFDDPVGLYVSRGKELISSVVQFFSPSPKRETCALEGAGGDGRSLQEDSEEYIFDRCRAHDPDGSSSIEPSCLVYDLPPTSLQYEGFVHFFNIFDGRKDIPGGRPYHLKH